MNKISSDFLRIIRRLIFVLLTSTVLTIFSEKAYWYMQGYELVGLVLYYAVPAAACLWAVHFYRVRDHSGMVLIGALYAFLVEGILTPVIYEAGLLDPVMPAYFIGWHGLLGMFFGWYLLRFWLVKKRWQKLLSASFLFGLFWGLWSLTQWLPENIAEFEALARAGEPVRPWKWSPQEFTLYALFFTLILMLVHWLLGRDCWKTTFQLSGPGKGILLLTLAGLFGLLVIPVQPLAVIKLIVLLGLVLLPLELQRRKQPRGSILVKLEGRIRLHETLPLLAMPAAASLVYWLAYILSPGKVIPELINESAPFIQALIGGAAYLWAAGKTLIPRSKNQS